MSIGLPQALGPSAIAQGLRNFVTGPGGGKPPPSRKERDFFPLPVLPVQSTSGYSRRCRQRIQARNRPAVVVNEAVETLNWMNGYGFETEVVELRDEDNTGATAEVFARLTDLAHAMDAEAEISSEAAFRELLKGRSEYTLDGSTSLAPFKLESVSLPDSLAECRPVSDLCGDEGRRYLERRERMALSAEEMRDSPPEEISPYTDPVLKHNRPLYLKFIKKLMGIDFLCWTRYPKCRAGVFFVWKSDGRIRMIIDARRSNRMFRPPPGVDLCTAEGLSRTEVVLPAGVTPWSEEGKKKIAEVGLCLGLADVDNCFHRCRQPFWLAEHFALEPVRASEVNMVGHRVSGEVVGPDDEIFPCPGSLCMGFSWSLYFAQCSSEEAMRSCPSLAESSLVTDRNGNFTFDVAQPDKVKHTVYVDNLGVVSQNGSVIPGILEEMDKEFEVRQLLLHPSSVHTDEAKHLGTKMDLRRLCSTLTRSRYEKLKGGLRAVLRRQRISGRLLEVVIGHCTFAGLACRPLLSIFHACYKFINRHYFERALVWKSVKDEVRAFMGGLIFCRSDWCRQWNPVVQCTDSSKSGWGITSAVWERDQVAAVGRVLERSRFKRNGVHSARESALAEADLDPDNLKKNWRDGNLCSEDFLRDSGWALDGKFPEVPRKLLRKDLWEPRCWGRWDFDEHITLLEGRTMTKACKRVAMTVYGKNSRQLMLGDNLSAVLSFERCRAKDFKLLVQVRKACSYQLAVNMHMAYRWIPSELCSADSASRLYDPQAAHKVDQPLLASHGPPEEADCSANRTWAEGSEETGAFCTPQWHGPGESQPCPKGPRSEAHPTSALGEGDDHKEVGRHQAAGDRKRTREDQQVKCKEASATCPRRGRYERKLECGGSQRGNGKQEEAADSRCEEKAEQVLGLHDGGRKHRTFGAGESGSDQERRQELPGACGEVGEPPGRARRGRRHKRRSDDRQRDREVHEQVVVERGEGAHWEPLAGRLDSQVRRIQQGRQALHPSKLEGFERVAEADAHEVSQSLPLGRVGSGGFRHGAKGPTQDGNLRADAGLNVCQAQLPVMHDEGWADTTNRRSHRPLDVADASRRGAGAVENRRVRFECGAGQPVDENLDLACLRGAPADRRRRAMGLQVRQCGCRNAADLGSARHRNYPLPSPALRTEHRPSPAAEADDRREEARKLEILEKRGKIREERQVGSVDEKADPGDKDFRCRMRKTSRGLYVRPSRGHSLARGGKGCYFLDCFSGEGGVSREVRQLYFASREYEISFGPCYDLTRRANLKVIHKDIEKRKVLASMIAPPCESWSPARDRTSVIRNKSFPWGLPREQLSDRDFGKVLLGNKTMRSAIEIVKHLHAKGLPWGLENPHASKCWNLEFFQRLQRDEHVTTIVLDFCAFGTAWRKRTRILVGNVQEPDLGRLFGKFCPSRDGICSFSGKPHFQLTGSNHKGVPWTRIAQPYPAKLCKQLAHVLTCRYHF